MVEVALTLKEKILIVVLLVLTVVSFFHSFQRFILSAFATIFSGLFIFRIVPLPEFKAPTDPVFSDLTISIVVMSLFTVFTLIEIIEKKE